MNKKEPKTEDRITNRIPTVTNTRNSKRNEYDGQKEGKPGTISPLPNYVRRGPTLIREIYPQRDYYPQQRIAGVTCACIRWNVHRTRRVCVRRGGASRRCSVGGNVYQPVSCMKLPGRRYIATEREMVRRDQRGVTAAAGRGANGPWCVDDGRFVATT